MSSARSPGSNGSGEEWVEAALPGDKAPGLYQLEVQVGVVLAALAVCWLD